MHDAVANAIAKGDPERARKAMFDIVDEVCSTSYKNAIQWVTGVNRFQALITVLWLSNIGNVRADRFQSLLAVLF